MLIAVLVISLVIGFVVAAGVVGSQAHLLGRQRREPVWRLAEAAAYIGDLLPYDIAAGLNAEELEVILRVHLNQLQFGPRPSEDDESVQPPDPRSDLGSDPMAASAVEERASTTELYRTLRRDGREVTLEQVTAVSGAHLEYLQRIGALAAVRRDGR
ncbi:hypothetical protein [Candidatus Poriferisodalis sp.]|uniref:hypothetical protein n=1 Tax=Candidatus Poriferisodalis sp. TaxID=3101277 RepID=UPI003B01EF8F